MTGTGPAGAPPSGAAPEGSPRPRRRGLSVLDSMAGKLWLGIVLLALFIVTASVFVFLGASQERAANSTITGQIHPLELENLRARADFAKAQVAGYALLATGQSRYRGQYLVFRTDTFHALAEAHAVAAGQSLQDVLAQQTAAREWFRFGDQMLAIPPGSPSTRRLANASYPSGQAVYLSNVRLQDRLRALSAAAGHQGDQALRTAVVLSAVAGGLAVVLGLAAGVATVWTVTRPLNRLGATVGRLAHGDRTARAAVAGSAEVRDVARSVNTLADETDRLRQREQEATQLRATVLEAGRRIRDHLEMPDLIRAAVAGIEASLPGDTAYLHLVRDGRLCLPEGHKHDWIMPREFLDTFTPALLEMTARLLSTHTSIVVSDLDGLEARILPPEQVAFLRAAGVRAMLVTPFGVGDQLTGIIAGIRRSPGRPWSGAEVAAFDSIAADIGRALDHARQYEAENRLVAELKALDRRKSDFIASISHELRTPLTSIAGYLEIVCDEDAGPLTDTQRGMLETISRNTTRLRNLIEDMLTLSQIESGTFRTALSPVDLAGIVPSAVEALRPSAESAGLFLSCHCPEEGLTVAGDAGQLDRMLMNLLSNAVKFTLEGGRVEVAARRADGWAVITVRDTGIGIPDADKGAMFAHFFRASNAVDRSIPGTGLGLSIVRTIVANHGGELSLDSREGRGTLVTVRLPLRPGGPATREPGEQARG